MGINSATGDIMPYTAPTDELRLEMAEAHALVAYAKKTLKQPWAAEPVGHRLRASGRCHQLVSLQYFRIRPYPHSLLRSACVCPQTACVGPRWFSPALAAHTAVLAAECTLSRVSS